MAPNTILRVEDLHTYFFTDLGLGKALNGVSFDVAAGRCAGDGG